MIENRPGITDDPDLARKRTQMSKMGSNSGVASCF